MITPAMLREKRKSVIEKEMLVVAEQMQKRIERTNALLKTTYDFSFFEMGEIGKGLKPHEQLAFEQQVAEYSANGFTVESQPGCTVIYWGEE
mgnify:CR=1 FL=1